MREADHGIQNNPIYVTPCSRLFRYEQQVYFNKMRMPSSSYGSWSLRLGGIRGLFVETWQFRETADVERRRSIFGATKAGVGPRSSLRHCADLDGD